MPWTAPATRATGDLITAAIWNTDLKDNLNYLRDTEIAYAQIVADVSVTATSSATPNDVVSSGAVTYTGEKVLIEGYFAHLTRGTTNIYVDLWDDATRLAQMSGNSYTATINGVSVANRRTPSAASHTYKFRAYVDAGTGTVGAGPGDGTGSLLPPSFIRVSKVAA